MPFNSANISTTAMHRNKSSTTAFTSIKPFNMSLRTLVFLSLSISLSSVNAFTVVPSFHRKSSSSLFFSIPSAVDFSFLTVPSLSSSPSLLSSSSSSAFVISHDLSSSTTSTSFYDYSSSISNNNNNNDDADSLVETTFQAAKNQLMEAKLFTGMAHVTLDLAAFVSRGTAWLRLGAVMGRLFVLGADYLPDHSVNVDEFLFQVFMMSISLIGLIHSVLPALLAVMNPNINKETFMKDGRAFQVLFRNVGLSWFQYKSLVASQALEWVTVAPGQVITSEEQPQVHEHDPNGKHDVSSEKDDGVYWLYRGQVQVESQGKLLHNVTRSMPPRLSDTTLGLFGETRLVEDQYSFPPTTLTAGETGAVLLRIRSEKLKSLMAHDVHMAESVRKLLFRSMQDKLKAALLLPM